MFRRKEPEPDPVVVALQKEVSGSMTLEKPCRVSAARVGRCAARLALHERWKAIASARPGVLRARCAAATGATRGADPASADCHALALCCASCVGRALSAVCLRRPLPSAHTFTRTTHTPVAPGATRHNAALTAAPVAALRPAFFAPQNARLTRELSESERHHALKEQELQLLQDGQDMLQQQLRVRARLAAAARAERSASECARAEGSSAENGRDRTHACAVC
jgi:hypothetical protein